MSVVACKVYKDRVEFASDSQVTLGFTKSDSSDMTFAKLSKVGAIIIGSVGLASEGALMQLYSRTHFPKEATYDGMLEFIGGFAEWKKKRTDNASITNSYLFGVGGRAFYVNHFFISEVATISAIGSGENYALTALHLKHSPEEAVGIACQLNIYCQLPVVNYTMKRK